MREFTYHKNHTLEDNDVLVALCHVSPRDHSPSENLSRLAPTRLLAGCFEPRLITIVFHSATVLVSAHCSASQPHPPAPTPRAPPTKRERRVSPPTTTGAHHDGRRRRSSALAHPRPRSRRRAAAWRSRLPLQWRLAVWGCQNPTPRCARASRGAPHGSAACEAAVPPAGEHADSLIPGSRRNKRARTPGFGLFAAPLPVRATARTGTITSTSGFLPGACVPQAAEAGLTACR